MKFPLPTCQFTLVSCSCCCLACVCVCVCVVCVCVHTCIHHTCVSVCVRFQQSVITSECDDCQPSKIPRALLDNKPMVTLDKLSASTMWYTYRVSLGGAGICFCSPLKNIQALEWCLVFAFPLKYFLKETQRLTMCESGPLASLLLDSSPRLVVAVRASVAGLSPSCSNFC